jgi:hypothetical protein
VLVYELIGEHRYHDGVRRNLRPRTLQFQIEKINMDITGVIKSLDTGSWGEIIGLFYRYIVNVCKPLS